MKTTEIPAPALKKNEKLDKPTQAQNKVGGKLIQNKIEKSCAVCKHANHDPSLGDREQVICILNPNKPELKESNDTCLTHELKYKNLKVIVDHGTMLEYDSTSAKVGTTISGPSTAPVKDAGLVEVGDNEWL